MDQRLAFKLFEEVRQQCQFGKHAWRNLRSNLNALDSNQVFFYVHAFLHHSVNISRFLWPDRESSKGRGDQMRKELGVQEDSPLRMANLRKLLEHFDERLENWAANLENRDYVDMNIMPQGTMSDFKTDTFHRSIDPEVYQLELQGQRCDLRAIAKAQRELEEKIDHWLKKNNPW